MQKGKFGVCLWFYAVLAFVLAFLGQTLLCGLLLGFVILAEKNEWLSKQVMQAFFLTLASSLVGSVLDILNVFRSIPFVGTAVSVQRYHRAGLPDYPGVLHHRHHQGGQGAGRGASPGV